VDLASLVGLVGAFGIVIFAMMLGGSIGMFIDVASVLIVIVGSIFAVMMKFELSGFISALKTAGKAFSFKMVKPDALVGEIVELAGLARKGGLLSLEGKEVSEPFLSKGIQLLVDGHDPDIVKTLLTKELKLASGRHDLSIGVFKSMGDVAPAMGMIGTLIGLVAMLANMSDPKAIGPAMAIALLTTLYGAMIANMIALPIAEKLMLRRDEEDLLKAMIIDALLAIQSGQNPRVIESMLLAYIQEGKRVTSGD